MNALLCLAAIVAMAFSFATAAAALYRHRAFWPEIRNRDFIRGERAALAYLWLYLSAAASVLDVVLLGRALHAPELGLFFPGDMAMHLIFGVLFTGAHLLVGQFIDRYVIWRLEANAPKAAT